MQGGAAPRTAPAERVWEVLPEVFSDLGLSVIVADSATRVLASTQTMSVWGPLLGPASAPHARCTVPTLQRTLAAAARGRGSAGGVPVSIPSGRVVLTVESTLAETDGDATRIRTRVILSTVATWGAAGTDEPHCVSTGRLEDRVAERLRGRIEAADAA